MRSIVIVFLTILIFHCTLAAKQNGMVFAGWGSGVYNNANSDESLTDLVQSKANWVSIVGTWYQPTISDTTIAPTSNSPTDADITHFTQKAKALGLKVVFKPHVDLSNDASHWRGQIGQAFTTTQWQTWFSSYQQYMTHMATQAQQLGVDMFIVGTELVASDAQDQLWRNTIAVVRAIYKGPLVYGANWYPFTDVTWWDALDFIGCDAYYPLANSQNPPLQTIISGWSTPLAQIEAVATKFNKQVIFTEIGYESNSATAMAPAGANNGVLSIQAQADCYQAFFQTVYPLSWFAGVYWWAWSPDPSNGGKCDAGFSPHNKTAEAILQKYYSANQLELDLPMALTIYLNGVLSSDWQDWSYSGTVDWKSTTNVQQGEQFSAQASLQSYGTVSIHNTGFSTTGYTLLTFAIAGTQGYSNFVNVVFVDTNNNGIYSLSIANYLANCTVVPTWQRVSMPLRDLHSVGVNITRVDFVNTGSSNALFYLDQIYFM